MRRKKIWTLGLVACLSLAIAGFADHKPGHTKGGGGGGDATLATVSSIGDPVTGDPGAFVFDGLKNVTINVKQNRLQAVARSEQTVEMTRPDEVLFPHLADTWDKVFAGCPGVLNPTLKDPPPTVESFFVGRDDWKINFLFDTDSDPFDVRLVLLDLEITFEDGMVLNTGIALQLVGEPNYVNNPIPPATGEPSEFTLTHFVIFAHGRGPKTPCRLKGSDSPGSGELVDSFGNARPSTLSITAR